MKSCLVVDDSKVIRKVARQILEELDFQVEEAVDGQDALDQCTSSMPDAILLDWNMPIMNGIEFLQALSKSIEGAMPTVVFCTTVNDLPHIQMAMEAGASEYIMKPFDRDILESKFAQIGLV